MPALTPQTNLITVQVQLSGNVTITLTGSSHQDQLSAPNQSVRVAGLVANVF